MSSENSIIDIKSWDGTISFGEFYVAACAFAEQWKKFSSGLPQWSWVKCPKPHGVPATRVEGYLCMDGVIIPRSTMDDNHECGDGGVEEMVCLAEEELIDSAVLSDVSLLKVQQHKHERCHYDFHVVYSLSYRVPVLYFRAYWSVSSLVFALFWDRNNASIFLLSVDGQPLALGDVENGIPASTLRELNEHPYLNRPWFTLHPCGTSEWMKLLFTSDASAVTLGRVAVDRYLVSWFSVVAQVFGLKLPSSIQYIKTLEAITISDRALAFSSNNNQSESYPYYSSPQPGRGGGASAPSSSTTSVHVTALDGLVNVNSLFTVAVFVGLSLATPGQKSLEERSNCDAGIDVVKKLLVFEVVSFSFFLFSSLVAQGLKLAINLLNSKDADEAFRAHVNAKVLRLGMVGSAVGSVMGCLFLMLSMVNVIEIRLGMLSCGSKSAVHTVAVLVILVTSALLVYISTVIYAFLH
nr:ubiquitin-like-conjugating enzyme ATG10 [Ipomoea batatas]